MTIPDQSLGAIPHREFTREEWQSMVTDAKSSAARNLTSFPRLFEPADFVSCVLFLAQQWRDPNEAARMLREVASLISTERLSVDEAPVENIEVAAAENEASFVEGNSHADAQWALQQWESGAFDGRAETYVAIFNRKILEFSNDPKSLKERWAKTLGVPACRILVDYIGSGE